MFAITMESANAILLHMFESSFITMISTTISEVKLYF